MSLARFRSAWSLLALTLSLKATPALAGEPTFCGEEPTSDPQSLSVGKSSEGRLLGAKALESGEAIRTLPRRHERRCLNWGTPRLVEALRRAGEAVRQASPDSPPLGVGDLSKARGGPIRPYSRSHQSGRDADLAFYQLDEHGQPVPAEDLLSFDAQGQARNGKRRFDKRRNWLLVRALLEDKELDVQWMFISKPLRQALLEEARRLKEPARLLERAEQVLHQPTDSRPHDDHFHLRIRCTPKERAAGCVG
jgi:penicillin-insensitive murein endopeptidase